MLPPRPGGGRGLVVMRHVERQYHSPTRVLARPALDDAKPPSIAMNRDACLLGLNYWPARTFTSMWAEFDAGRSTATSTRCRRRTRLVRFFLFWADFEPEPDRIDSNSSRISTPVRGRAGARAAADAYAVRRAHQRAQLAAGVAMSGRAQQPADGVHRRGRRVAEQAARHVRRGHAIVDAVRGSCGRSCGGTRSIRVWGWDLFNEINFVQIPERAPASGGSSGCRARCAPSTRVTR